MGAAEKGVGRAAQSQSLIRSHCSETTSFGKADPERLLGIDMLAGGDRRQADRHVRIGHGQVEHDLDGWIGEQVLHRDRP